MVNMYRESPDGYVKHYNRRSVIESIFSNEEEDAIFSKVKDNQVVETLCRAAVWNAISLAYHMI